MDGQLNKAERDLITSTVLKTKPSVALEVGTWKGGGSTLHILNAMKSNQSGHLWGIEASREIYNEMIANISSAGDDLVTMFTPIFGFSQVVIPDFLKSLDGESKVDFAFLDGGDNPMEQIEEFQLLRESMPVGGMLLSHDAKLRKGKWLVPYLSAHDNWDCAVHDISDEGLLVARKTAPQPSPASLQKAAATLRSLRLQPKEFIGRHLPSWVINAILIHLPRKLVIAITQDRK
jgi:hypothetical protein